MASSWRCRAGRASRPARSPARSPARRSWRRSRRCPGPERIEVAAQGRPRPRAAAVLGGGRRPLPLAGPAEVSSPRISVVTPSRTLLVRIAVLEQSMSECECMSTNPGATTSPRASMIRRAAASRSQTAHRGDPVAADRHVAFEPGIAGAVDDLAAADQDVDRARGQPAGRTRGDSGQRGEPHQCQPSSQHGRSTSWSSWRSENRIRSVQSALLYPGECVIGESRGTKNFATRN